MGITERDKKRLDALFEIIKPPNSLSARRDTLSDDQRDFYDGWKAHCERWLHRNGERGYELTLNGYCPVELRHDIIIALFGEMPRILEAEDESRAAEKYRGYCND
jgi:hypothetical protein